MLKYTFMKKFYQNEIISFVLLEFDIPGNSEFEQQMKKELIEIGNLHMF